MTGRIGESALRADGTLDRSLFPNCNVFCVRSIAALAGYRDTYYFETVVLISWSSYFHTEPVKGPSGRTIGHATHVDLAAWSGQRYREATQATREGNLRQFTTDPSSGTTIR